VPHIRSPASCLPQAFGAPELVEGVYASESTLHSSVAFLRNTLAGAAPAKRGLAEMRPCACLLLGAAGVGLLFAADAASTLWNL